jgi:hypothetical protein
MYDAIKAGAAKTNRGEIVEGIVELEDEGVIRELATPYERRICVNVQGAGKGTTNEYFIVRRRNERVGVFIIERAAENALRRGRR